jgi:hypothetical protein
MKKDFEKWNGKKKNIHENSPRVFFNVGQIWFAYLGANIGFEQDGSGFVISEEDSESSVAILSQIRLFDAKRLRYPSGTLAKEQFNLLVDALLALIGKKVEK